MERWVLDNWKRLEVVPQPDGAAAREVILDQDALQAFILQQDVLHAEMLEALGSVVGYAEALRESFEAEEPSGLTRQTYEMEMNAAYAVLDKAKEAR